MVCSRGVGITRKSISDRERSPERPLKLEQQLQMPSLTSHAAERWRTKVNTGLTVTQEVVPSEERRNAALGVQFTMIRNYI